ncbi:MULTISPECIES: CBS domain-containing protein [Acinetobacter]|jgi:CBS domain-containing protein|uniref:CBS domain-containing protein n=1 Tax=Acinetobacter TaxID=469 RepID=UPI0014447D38|nr:MULTISPECIES: CBS domain-containing protein [Acinetobacter]MBF4520987.1 CBS domain-containing protein [Acinetobacter towneri]MDM1486196.1 CBS domain-containing protein [Acinetobacter towneri]MEB6565530.1 CBS domain-containing protein [Acinetobacter towneri]NLN56459.1 CBS domain-containing protein [Gammaproteobacteria bacterium]
MTKVTHVLQDKAHHEIYTIHPEATVLEAISLMADKGIGALVVTDQNQHVVGILSERDYTRKVILMERTSKGTTVSEIMTAKVLTVTKNTSVEECLSLITDHHLRHLPVLENEQLVGLVSIGDLVKATMDDQRKLIDQLQQYIAS